jgi:hypothetical protein
MPRGWYEMVVKSMGSESVWCGRKEVDSDISSVVGGRGWVVVSGRGQRGGEGRRREELGCWMHVRGMVRDDGGEYAIRECPAWAQRARW